MNYKVIMRLFAYQYDVKFRPLIADEPDEEASKDVPKQVKSSVNTSGYPLTLIFLGLTLICSLAWYYAINLVTVTTKNEVEFIQFVSKLEDEPPQCLSVPLSSRFDCDPSRNVTEGDCLKRGCCWEQQDGNVGVPFCFYPTGHKSYSLHNISKVSDGAVIFYQQQLKSGYPNDLQLIRMDIKALTLSTLNIKIYDPIHQRFEVPFYEKFEENIQHVDIENEKNEIMYTVRISSTDFGFQIIRPGGSIIFDTLQIGGFVFADQLLQMSSFLPSHYVYGIGETNTPFLRDTDYVQTTMWNFDNIPLPGDTNMYGSQPFYMVMEGSGEAHGVFIKNSNAMEIMLLPTPALTIRSIGGIFDLYFFLGPVPDKVVEQFTDIIGKPFLPPYWSLGYHQCRFGYNTLNRTKEIMEQTIEANIPLDTQWNDLDYMRNRNDFTIDNANFAGLTDFINKLHENGMHYIPIVDPGISGGEAKGSYAPYDLGLDMNVFVKNSTGNVFVGRVWNPKSTVWPDFTHPNATKYWTQLFQQFFQKMPFDGAWIDMNDPSNFESGQINLGCDTSDKLNVPPYTPRMIGEGLHASLYYHTICPSAKHTLGNHYDLHNAYGFTEAIVTNKALKSVRNGRRPFIISRSTFPGHGHYAGHWTGDIHSDWESLSLSIAGILNFNMFGIPMVGADICGFNGNTTVKLCQRWMELGAFYPFARNHNSDENFDQDPVSLGPDVVKASKKALDARYTLLPYLYTLFFKAHLHGTPVARALFYDYPLDRNTYNLGERQFLWGSNLMICPVVEQDETEVVCYFPGGNDDNTAQVWWYDFYTHQRVISSIDSNLSEGFFANRHAPLDTIPLFARGGAIFAMKPAAQTTTQSRLLPFNLRVYLDSTGRSSGELIWDDGDDTEVINAKHFNQIKFDCQGKKLGSKIVNDGYKLQNWKSKDEMILGYVDIFGVTSNSSSGVVVNGHAHQFHYDSDAQMLKIPGLSLDLTKPFLITY